MMPGRDGVSVTRAVRAAGQALLILAGHRPQRHPGPGERARQILRNLLGNAIRHGKGEVRLEARPVDDGRRIRLGIRNRIAGGDTSLLGTGMGLRLVRAIVGTLGDTLFQTAESDGVFEATLELPC